MGLIAGLVGEFRQGEQFMRTAAASDSVSATCRSYALECRSLALWVLGFPDQALALAREGLKLAENADDRYIHAAVFQWAGRTHTACGELAEAEELFRRSLNLGTESGFPWVRASNTLCIGLVSVLRTQPQAGLEQLRRGMEYLSTSSAFGQEPQFFAHDTAMGLAAAGRPEEAFATLIPALEWGEKNGVVQDLAGMHLVKGRLLEGQFHLEEAENSFRTAIEIARRQSAKSPELRTTTSLARLLAKQGRGDEARAMLADIYNWFTEGFDTADLKDARALLDELSVSS